MCSLCNHSESCLAQIQNDHHSDPRLGKDFPDLLNMMDVAVWELDLDYRIVACNDKAKRLFGEDIIGQFCYSVAADPDAVCADCPIKSVYQGRSLARSDHQRIDISGNRISIDQIATPIQDKQGRLTGVLVLIIDITQRKRKEADLREHCKQLEQLVVMQSMQNLTERQQIETNIHRLAMAIEQVADSVLITDDEPKVLYVNPAFEKITGYLKEEIIGKNPSLLQSGRHDQQFYQEMWNTLKEGRVWRGRFQNKRKNGTPLVEDASISPVIDNSGRIINYVSVKRDVSKEMDLEKRLHQAMKMEAIGTLAGGIAHDFNNILSSVIGFTELTLDDVPPESLQAQNLNEVLTAGIRAKKLVNQILAFARQSVEEIKPLQVGLVAKEALKLIRSTVPATIRIQTDIKSKSLIMADPTQIHQVIMNLCTNAVHSMEDTGGLLKVDLRDETYDDKSSESKPYLKPGDYLKLTVSDTGAGICQDSMDLIFEPYFTTKAPGEGTGLGLSTVYGIVKKYGGEMVVESKVEKGSSFHALFPVSKLRNEKPDDPPTILPTGVESILCVDDELSIAKMSAQILESLGYDVTIRTSSIEALVLFKTKPQTFDLVITDLTMPNMTGDQLAVEMMKIRPDIPVILCTGFSRYAAEKDVLASGIKAFAHKPLIKSDLAILVRNVLDQN